MNDSLCEDCTEDIRNAHTIPYILYKLVHVDPLSTDTCSDTGAVTDSVTLVSVFSHYYVSKLRVLTSQEFISST